MQSKDKRQPEGTAAAETAHPRITVIEYDEKSFEERDIAQIDELTAYRDRRTVSWIDIADPNPEILAGISDIFKLHPLTIEDILHREHRPKTEDMVDYVLVVARMFPHMTGQEGSHRVTARQVSLVVGKHFLLSFHEGHAPPFDPVREKLRKYKGRIRRMGSDYLLYRLLDAIVDTYFSLLETMSDRIELLEEQVVANPDPVTMRAIHALRINMSVFYRSVWPLREVVGALRRDDLPLISKGVEAYFRDVYDHTIQIIETMEADRERVSEMLDIYVSSVSNRMNEIMKVLTVIATIFIPMTFLAGVWGMNFRYMPELEWRWAYGVFWCLMVAIAIFMLLYFRRKKWL